MEQMELFEEFMTGLDNGSTTDILGKFYSLLRNIQNGKKDDILLKELLVDGMHTEQIWQQIDLLNKHRASQVKKSVKGEQEEESLRQIEKLTKILRKSNEEEQSDEDDSEEDVDDDAEGLDSEADLTEDHDDADNLSEVMSDESDGIEIHKNDGQTKEGDLDADGNIEDGFLNLDEMHRWMDEQDAMGDEDTDDLSDQGIDLFADQQDSSTKSASDCRYADFFDVPDFATKASTSKSENPTSFEKMQSKLRDKIEQYEEENVNEKSWVMKGEASAAVRPQNSVLEEYLDFDQATRLAPVITEEVTLILEDIIKLRIKDKAFDDVERKKKPSRDAAKYRNQLVLDQEKSKVSLSQVYEQEFLKQNQKDETEKKNPLHESIKDSMKQLFRKLDALSNYHYTPAMPVSEVKLVNNMPSLQMEEVGPETATQASMLAPEEIKTGSVSDPKALAERTGTDKKRALRKKKVKSAKRAQLQLERQVGSAVDKDKLQQLRKVGKVNKAKLDPNAGKSAGVSSAKFFSRLQSEVQADISKRKASDTNATNKKRKTGAEYKL